MLEDGYHSGAPFESHKEYGRADEYDYYDSSPEKQTNGNDPKTDVLLILLLGGAAVLSMIVLLGLLIYFSG